MEEMIMAGHPNPNPNANPNPPPAPPSGADAPRAPGPGPPAAATKRKASPQKHKAINCPRCYSTNTKFCYYNNYSLQQPRYFCKTCRRYWTDGGSLRNLPVGGGSRKNKRSSSSSVVSSAASTSATAYRTVPVGGMHQDANDLNLVFPHHHGRVLHQPEYIPGDTMAANGTGGGMDMDTFWVMELLRSTGCYLPLPQVQLGMQPEYHQQVHNMLGFSLDTGGGGDTRVYGAGLQGAQESATGRLLFPLEDLKLGVNAAGGGASGGSDQFEHSKDQGGGGGHETLGFWNNSMLGNGSSNGGGSW